MIYNAKQIACIDIPDSTIAKQATELLYVAFLFHDLGLMLHYSNESLWFEVHGANAARDFLKSHDIDKQKLQLVWDTIALHTTIGIAEYKENKVVLMYSDVGLNVMEKVMNIRVKITVEKL